MYPLIRHLTAKNFRCLRDVDLSLQGGLHLLVGPNGSGKSTLLDAILFVSDLASKGLLRAVQDRTDSFQDLIWGKPDQNLEFRLGFHLEVLVDEEGEAEQPHSMRYDVTVLEDGDEGLRIGREMLQLRGAGVSTVTIDRNVRLTECSLDGERLGVVHHGNDTVFRYLPSIVGTYMDRDGAPTTASQRLEAVAALWGQHVVTMVLEGQQLRSPSSSDLRSVPHLNSTGSNLPWMIQRLQQHKANFNAWLKHLRTVVEDIEYVRVVLRAEDRKAYVVGRRAGVSVRSLFVPDGLLHLMALSLPAYLPTKHGQILMIEEPENSMHPLAIDAAYESLSDVYDSHVLVATHSPLLLGCVDPEVVLCFTQDSEGGTRVVPGSQHPHLKYWRNRTDNDLLFARDIL